MRDTGDIVWHGHHRNDCPIEQLQGTIEARREAIRRKPRHEQAVRLRLLRPCSDEATRLWAAYPAAKIQLVEQYQALHSTLRAEYEAAEAPLWAQYEVALAPLREAHRAAKDALVAAYQTARQALLLPILALHQTECRCTEWNGEQIVFPQNRRHRDGRART